MMFLLVFIKTWCTYMLVVLVGKDWNKTE